MRGVVPLPELAGPAGMVEHRQHCLDKLPLVFRISKHGRIPEHLGKRRRSAATTGAPQAIASTGGKPNPSLKTRIDEQARPRVERRELFLRNEADQANRGFEPVGLDPRHQSGEIGVVPVAAGEHELGFPADWQ